MAFSGDICVKLDDKGRLILPSVFRSQATFTDPLLANRFFVQKDLFKDCLVICTMETWNKRAQEMMAKLDMFDPEQRDFWQEFNRDTAEVILDEKTGRILVPKILLDRIGVDKEVVFVGVVDEINLWNKEKYEASIMPRSQVASLAQKFLGSKPK